MRMLRSLLRTAACSSVSDATGAGLAGRPRPRGGGAAAPEAASLPPSPACPRSADRCLGRPPLSISSELLPTQSSRRRVPVSVPPSQPLQPARTLLMSECSLQFPFLPGRIGVHTISPMIRSSNIQGRTAESLSSVCLFVCKYLEILARPSSGKSQENED
jgi:hypothetical protein